MIARSIVVIVVVIVGVMWGVCMCILGKCISLSVDCQCDISGRGQGMDSTKVFPIWVVMKFKFGDPIRKCIDNPNRATKLRFHHDPNRENFCAVHSLSAAGDVILTSH